MSRERYKATPERPSFLSIKVKFNLINLDLVTTVQKTSLLLPIGGGTSNAMIVPLEKTGRGVA